MLRTRPAFSMRWAGILHECAVLYRCYVTVRHGSAEDRRSRSKAEDDEAESGVEHQPRRRAALSAIPSRACVAVRGSSGIVMRGAAVRTHP